MSLPKYKSVKFCSNCGRERDMELGPRSLNSESRTECDPGHIRVWCHACGHFWYEQLPATPPDEETKTVRVTVDKEEQCTARVHVDGYSSHMGLNVSLPLGMRPGKTGTLSWKPDPEPVFAKEYEETTRVWRCSACGARLPFALGEGCYCPHCGVTFNADPKHLE